MGAAWGKEGGGWGFWLAELSKIIDLIGCFGIVGLTVDANIQRQQKQSPFPTRKMEKGIYVQQPSMEYRSAKLNAKLQYANTW